MESTIRKMNRDEMDEVLALSQFAFQYTLTDDEKEERLERLSYEEIWGLIADGRLASKLHVLDLEIYLAGKRWKMGGIAAVATWPEYRRGGFVEDLLQSSLKRLKETGYAISMLHPFKFEFYRRYGWETFVQYKKYKIDMDRFSPFKKMDGFVERTGRKVHLLNSIYNQYAVNYNGMLLRTEQWWNTRVFTKNNDQAAVYYRADGTPGGYVLYYIKEEKMTIHEMVHLDHESLLGLLAFIRQHDSMAESVEVPLPDAQEFSFLFENPRMSIETKPYFMARIVDAGKVLEDYPFRIPSGKGNLFLHVSDGFAEWNEATFQIGYDTGSLNMAAHKKTGTGSSCTHLPRRGLTLDIQTLAAVLFGYQQPSFLYETGRILGPENDVALLEEMLPKYTPFFNDFF